MTDGYTIGDDDMITALIALLCVLISVTILYGGFYLAKHVVERQHRVSVLEDIYREATEHIGALDREIAGLNQQIEHLQYEAQLAGERIPQPRSWNPSDPLNSPERRRQ